MEVGSEQTQDMVRMQAVEGESVFPLFRVVFGEAAESTIRKTWQWKYLQSPFMPGNGPRMFIAYHAGEIVGFHGAIPGRLKIGKEEYPLVWGADYAVDPKHRGRGIRLMRAFIAQQADVIKMGTPIGRAYELEKKIGCADVATLFAFRRILKPSRFFAEARPVVKISFTLLVGLANLCVDILSFFSKGADITVDHVEELGTEFDDFWETVKNDYEAITVRSRVFLQWRFLQCPHVKYSILGARRARKLVGYLVLRIRENGAIREGNVVDVLTAKNDTPVFSRLMGTALSEMREHGVHSATFVSTDSQEMYRRILRKSGFLIKKKRLPVIYGEYGLGTELLPQVKEWFLTAADSDFDME
jgi:GNAT superfamily N-acetyltransferase